MCIRDSSKDAAVAALEEGKVIFFAGGTGHPYFSTDTGAVLRAVSYTHLDVYKRQVEATLAAKGKKRYE